MEYQLQKLTENFTSIPITASCLEKIKTYAKLSGKREIYGFLLNPQAYTDGIVSRTIIAQQQAVTGSSVTLDPDAAALSKVEIENMGMKAIGFWHSHAGFGTFHSSTDDDNMERLYRDITQNNEETVPEDRGNFRYMDQANGRMVYRVGGLEVAIKLKDPERSCERRILTPESINFPKNSNLEMIAGKNIGMYLRDGAVILQLDNIDKFTVSTFKSPEDNALGLAYSLVVNEGGSEYGEIAAVKWCSKCEETSVNIHKKCTTKIIDDSKEPTEVFSVDKLGEEIRERTKHARFFR
ncbi:MAG: Mov34/MPN/PAD-1 family protein [archaeon]